MALLDQHLFSQIQRKLNEPPDAGQSFFSQRWTHDELVRIANDRQDSLLKTTHLQVGVAATIPGVPPVLTETAGDPIVVLPEDWIASVLLIRTPLGGAPYLVDGPADSWQGDNADSTMVAAPGVPRLFYDMEVETRTIRLVPAPAVEGRLLLYYIPRAATLTGAGEFCTVPDELARTTLIYGILADLLSKLGRGMDLPRASYCRQRWTLGAELTDLLLQGLP